MISGIQKSDKGSSKKETKRNASNASTNRQIPSHVIKGKHVSVLRTLGRCVKLFPTGTIFSTVKVCTKDVPSVIDSQALENKKSQRQRSLRFLRQH